MLGKLFIRLGDLKSKIVKRLVKWKFFERARTSEDSWESLG